MSVNTKEVKDRREIRYANLDELLAEAQRLATGPHHVIGNWTYAQILDHLAEAFTGSIDGFSFKAPWPMRIVAGLFMKKKFLRDGLPAGFAVPPKAANLMPGDVTEEESLEKLRQAIERLKSTDQRSTHPFFGKLSREESDEFQLRHAELHMSFVLEGDAVAM